MLGIDEADRSFSATVDLYLSRTGGRIASFAAFRTGNDRVRDALMKLAAQVAGAPAAARDAAGAEVRPGRDRPGTFQGVKKDDTLVIVRQGGVRLRPDGPGLAYDEKDVVGDFKVTGRR